MSTPATSMPTQQAEVGAVGSEAGEVGSAEGRLQHGFDLAYRFLAKRDRAVVEMRRHLQAHDVQPAVIARVMAELLAKGYVDDVKYAERFAEDRRTLDGWGAERIERRLHQLGVEADAIGPALAEREPEAELAAAVEVLRRRLPGPPADDRERNRALGLLARRGYDLELAHDAIRAFSRGG